MRRTFLLSIFIVAVASAAGRIPGQRIIGGVEATPHEFPWIVDVRVLGTHYCAGAIVNEEWIVTAAQCASVEPIAYQVVAGDHNINTNDPEQQNRQVEQIIVHPLYESPDDLEFQFDIAIMKVAPPFELNEFVQNISLPSLGLLAPNILTVAGWGAVEEDGESSAVLRKVDLPLVNDEECLRIFPGGISEDMICAGETGKDSCTGDSGGPLTCIENGVTYLCGIVSWGLGCARPNSPGVYTETSYFSQWVIETIVPPMEDNSTFVEQNEGCGGSLLGSSGQVSYKLGEQLGNNERCTWVLRANNKTDIRLEIYELGLAAGDVLTVTELDDDFRVGQTSVITTTGNRDFEGPIILVSLITKEETTGEGFRLHFYGTGYSAGLRRINWSTHFFGESSGSLEIRHPFVSKAYFPNEVVAVVINPAELHTILSVESLEVTPPSPECNDDALDIYRFSSTESKYVFLASYCADEVPPAISNKGPYLVIFRANLFPEHNGFRISYSTRNEGLEFRNPIFDANSADPAVIRVGNYYYMSLSENRETELTIFKSPLLTSFRDAPKRIAHQCVPGCSDLWASEMHQVDGELYIYFTMRCDSTDGGHRMYVIHGMDKYDPMGDWSDPIRLYPEDPGFGGIDGTVLKHGNGQKYYVWTSFAKLYIAPMISPTVMGEPRTVLREPHTSWECYSPGEGCQSEGPFFIYNRNVSYLVFSGLGTWDADYCLGMMTLDANNDPMDIDSWISWPDPVFWRNDDESVLGPGHASFTVSPDGTETWMIYHAHGNTTHEGRIARIEKIEWSEEDGTPIFPRPHGYNTLQSAPSGQAYL